MKNLVPTIKIGVISFKKGFASQGVVKTFQMFGEALVDEYYNKKCGLDVGGFFDPADCNDKLPNKDFANFYQPVRYRPFFKLFKKYNIIPKGRFIDIGSGKGKALILASQMGYTELLGIELFENLNMVALKNIEKFKKLNEKYQDTSFEVLTMDASAFKFDKKDCLIFLNDPFSDEVMKKFIVNIEETFKEHPRPMWVIFKNNNQRNLPSFYELKKIADYSVFETSGNYFEVFKFQ